MSSLRIGSGTGGHPTNQRHLSPTYRVTAIAVAALAAVLALALTAGYADSADCVTSNTGTSDRDILCGTSGADSMDGLGGGDLMFGRGGNDQMTGGSGLDTVKGESGNDILTGGLDGLDQLRGGSGNDRLRLRDGLLDALPQCGDGTADSLDLDLVDFAALNLLLVLSSCESVTVGAVNEGPNVVISRRTPKIKDKGNVPVSLTCPASLAAPCAGTLTLGSSENKQGEPKAYSIDPGNKNKVSARLSRRDRRKLSRSGRLTVSATSVEQGEFGDKTTVQTLKLNADD